MDSIIETLRGMGGGRLIALVGVGAGLIGFFVFIVSQVGSPTLTLLYGGLDLDDSSEIVTRLETMSVPYELRANGTQIFVPDDQSLRLRMTLAQEGLPSGGTVGYEIFDRGDALGVTSFVQEVNLVRALEGELSRTITTLDKVTAARVHVVLPKRELFQRDTREPSASVVLSMQGQSRLDPGQITSIQHLIAAAVPELKPSRISIVDDRGTLLARGVEDAGAVAGATRMDEFRIAFERRLKASIEGMLERSVGMDAVWAEVSADLNHETVTVSEEVFDPDGQVVRSSQSIEENAASRDAFGDQPVSVAQQLPEADAQGAGGNLAESNSSRVEEVVNFEITKTMTSRVTEAGALERLSVAVLVDGLYAGPEGAQVYEPRSADELEQIASLVRSAVGFDASRGDQVDVVNMRFNRIQPPVVEQVDAFLGLGKDDYFRVAELLIFGIVALLVVMLVLKPLVTRALAIAQAQAQAAAAEQAAEAQLIAAQQAALTAPDEAESVSEVDQMIDIAQVEGRVRASSLKKIGELVDKHPEEAVAILRNWLYQG